MAIRYGDTHHSTEGNGMPKPKSGKPPRVSLERLTQVSTRKAKSVRIRLTQAEHDEMMEVAHAYGLTLSEYLRQLHRQAVEGMERGGNR